jgi:hypothetical protein
MTRDSHDLLTTLTAATRARAEEVYASRVPDFAAMLARARELDPDLVSEASTAHAEALAPVIPIQHAHRDRSDRDALAPFTAATRAILAEQAARPALPRPPPPPLVRPRRTLALGLTALVALAAAMLLWQGPRIARLLTPQTHNVAAVADSPDELPQPVLDSPPARTTRREPPPLGEPVLPPAETILAPPAEPAPAETILAPPAEPAPAEPAPAETILAPPAEPAPAETILAPPAEPAPAETILAPPAEPAPAEPAPAEPVLTSPEPAASPRARPAPPPAPTIPLEDEAQALWQRGELAAAEQKFRDVVRRAGKSARAELAYGDLFALAGQLRGPTGQTALAREYLAAFPSGRFADDMRAGLCQRAAVDQRPACWRDYLAHHPQGAHQPAAAAALAEAPR